MAERRGNLEFNSPSRRYDHLFGTPETIDAFSDRNFLCQMLRFEAALAEALEEHQVIPSGTAQALSSVDPNSFDLEMLAEQAKDAGNVCIPFVKALTAKVAQFAPEAAAYVHWGATSQDVVDTALVLQMRAILGSIENDLAASCDALATLTRAHRHTVMPGRTWLQQGPPVTLGFKLATWLDALQRHRERLAQARARDLSLQFGGAVGTLAALGNKGASERSDRTAELE